MKNSDIKPDDLYPHPETMSDFKLLTDFKSANVIIISTSYHKNITGSMASSFINNSNSNIKVSDIAFIEVPGAFELPLMIKIMIDKYKPKFIVALGCIIKGDTKHDEYLASTVINGLRNLALEYRTPIINGVLTTNNLQQAIDRAGKKYDKGKDLVDTCFDLGILLDKHS